MLSDLLPGQKWWIKQICWLCMRFLRILTVEGKSMCTEVYNHKLNFGGTGCFATLEHFRENLYIGQH